MIDRWGKCIFVGWAEHEILWVEAALSLSPKKQTEAWLDIGEMTGRGASAVRRKAGEIVARRSLAELIAETERMSIRNDARGRFIPPAVMPSDLRKPSKAQLMGRRA